mmetsp:Transcript_25251/g.55362  ORF Transcript_25251/g.55362 Transcript_25251/m.55362 type:complete len:495 (-) Transcript_25251:91-1575(-)
MTSNQSKDSSSSSNNNNIASEHDSEIALSAIAASAGVESWQTWAGRKHGTKDFEALDVFRGMKRTIDNRLKLKIPVAGTTCPICFCEPDEPSSWHVTWCGHAVCKDCLAQYAASHIDDQERSGPLKCPVCLKILRKKDAIAAMMASDNKKELIQQWDTKIRDRLLRAIPSFQSCPKCEGGGGFVTPECLAPHYQGRRDRATRILSGEAIYLWGICALYAIHVMIIDRNKSQSAEFDLCCMLMPIYVFVKLGMATRYWLASWAREALVLPISVVCPCCDETFVLPIESTHRDEDDSSQWLKANTRPCPSCTVPIVKSSGCNHMRCTHCKASFCWACMNLQTDCLYYNCKRGAPYGNASPVNGGEWDLDGPILANINRFLDRRTCPDLHYRDALLILACLVGRHLSLMHYLGNEIITPLHYLGNEIITPLLKDVIIPLVFNFGFVAVYYLIICNDGSFWNSRHGNLEARGPQPNRGNANADRRMIQEAILRSLRDA